MLKRLWSLLFALCLVPVVALSTAHAEVYFPYVLADIAAPTVDDGLTQVKDRLSGAGFDVVGQYALNGDAQVLIATSGAQQALAAKSEHGGFGAATRISVTAVEGTVQVAYTDPRWMAHAYRLEDDGSALLGRLTAALGNKQSFGSAAGMEKERLRLYQYMIFMPDFEDVEKLASHSNYQAAVAAVEAGLQKGAGGTAKVYRIDIPGKEESLFGVALNEGAGADKAVMGIIDTAPLKHTAHLPYEMLVSGGKVVMLHGKFRMAQSFPDLSMGTFMEISAAPDAIVEALSQAASGK
ncbi:conserved hypothetical protein [Magnetococcus marinus MC-1]|uniref:Uncharacterized protein n=1 Tax=Magnetococcus marinus (strain ATCC BAA-1437 / JCM 17883 / MC-1) TaxID=156889 RepID=A0L4M5_MAGMM|nr:hypothetical protein [Magnetococcus marinus]ABK42918.1 conserved hypothetical protein [Magnetococcus marinus MC-1]